MSQPFRRPGRSPRRGALRLETLESREVPATLLGLTTTGNLVTFDSATPGTLTAPTVAVTGLAVTESLVGIDYRPATGGLFGISNFSKVYAINASTGVATAVSATAFAPALSGTGFGVDFNPLVDRIRVVGNSGQSLRVNQITGAATADPTLVYDPSAPENTGFFPGNPFPAPLLAAAGYTLNFDATAGTNVTTLYAIDTGLDALVRIGGPDGNPSPNGSLVAVVGELRDAGFTLVDFGNSAGLDIQAGSDLAFVSNGAALYALNLTTAGLTLLGSVGGGFALADIAIAPPAAGAGSLALSTASAAVATNRGPIAVTVNRTGGAAGVVAVDFATADGTAVAGVDYLPTSGTLTFADGETSRTIFLQVPAGTPSAGPAKTFTLTLRNATGGAALGAITAATVSIPEVRATAAPGGNAGGNTGGNTGGAATAISPTRFYAVGSSENARVAVYNANGGAFLFSFAAFEGGFTGAAQVATGDVNGDGFDDIIIGAGAGGGPRVQIIDGKTLTAANQTQLASFFAFSPAFTGGVSVAAGDVNADGFADVIVGAGAGGGPHVKVIDGRSFTGGAVVELASFFAFSPAFTGGVSVAAGNLDGDANADVFVGARSGGGPHVKAFGGSSLVSGGQRELASFFAFDPSFTGGVTLGAGDANGDGRTDVIVGAGRSGGPHVKVFDGRRLAAGNQTELASFYAFDPSFAGGVTVSARDLNRDGFDDVIVGAGPGGRGHVAPFDGRSLVAGRRAEFNGSFAFGSTFNGGVFVG